MKKFISILLCLALCFALMIPISAAAQGDVIELKVYDDLLKIKDNPSGSYKLMYDIDCAGHEWTPVDFSGNFDGNGHALLNLKITGTTTDVRTTIDGNWKQYDTYFSGFFGIVENATIENLSLLGVDADVTKNDNIYAAGLVGFMSDSTIKNCTVEGKVCLHTACKAFGVAGILGYGWGSVDSCTADVTVICVDTDKENRDEQFLGGIFGNGYPDITNCTVTIEGYDSDHGYVHDGGIGGMWILPGDVAADFGGFDAIVDGVLESFLKQFAGNVVVVDNECGLGESSLDIVNSGFEVEGDVVFVEGVGFNIDGVGIDFIDVLEVVGTQGAEFLSFHSLHFGFFAEVFDTLVVGAHEFVDVAFAFFLSLGDVHHGFEDGGSTLVDGLAVFGAVEHDLLPGLVAVGVVLLFVEFLIERDVADAGHAVVGGVAPFALCVGGEGSREGCDREQYNFQFFHG